MDPQNFSLPLQTLEDPQNPDHDQVDKNAIPKFASFRPKPPPPPQQFKDRRPQETENPSDLQGSTRDRAAGPPGHRRHAWDNYDHRERHRYRVKKGSGHHALSGKPEAVFENDEKALELYVVDREGDPDNLIFGTLHRCATPSYFRIGAGCVVGSTWNQMIDRAVSNEKGLVLSNEQHCQPRKGDKNAFRRVGKKRIREWKIKSVASQVPELEAVAEFISLESSPWTNRGRENGRSASDSSAFSSGDDEHYRSVEGKAKLRAEPDDQDLVYGSETSSPSDNGDSRASKLDEFVQKKRIELARKVDAEPTNCDAWVNLISYQDDMLGLNRSSKKSNFTNAERKSVADVKLSMYEKALGSVEDPEAQETLLLGMMEEAGKVLDSQKLSSKWKGTLESNPGYLSLWTKYLDFKQTTFVSFRYEEVQNSYLDCLSLLWHARGVAKSPNAEQVRLYKIQVYVLLRSTVFMKESGFTELAIAAWQALLEYEFFRPLHLQSHEHKEGCHSRQDTVSVFEEFWDSEVPRIGENGAEGWASFYQKPGESPKPRTEAVGTVEDGKEFWGSWIVSELEHGLLSRLPARTTDDVEENDPYRVILFSDVRPFLIDSPSVIVRQTLLDAFLIFCHLPPCTADDAHSRTRHWWREGFLRNDVLYANDKASTLWDFYADKSQTNSTEADPVHSDVPLLRGNTLFGFPLPDFQISSDCLFAAIGSWFSAFGTWHNVAFRHRGPLQVDWVLGSVKALVFTAVGGDHLAEYCLALELCLSPRTVKKTARNFLKKHPSSLRLYNAYALIEHRLGNASKGENVIITSISMSKQLDEVARRDSVLLWRTWIWELLSAGRTREAYRRLLTFADRETQTTLSDVDLSEDLGSTEPVLLLRTERALTAARDNMLSLSSHRHAALITELMIVLTYLKNFSSLPAATSTFKSYLTLFTDTPSKSPSLEYLHQSFARLLYHHATQTHLFKPSEIRLLLSDSIYHFPQNTIFISLYAWNEARFRIDDRVRSIVKDVVLVNTMDNKKSERNGSVIPHFFAIHNELHRGTVLGSNNHTVHSAFERAIKSESGAHCAGLWKFYVLFEQSRGDIEETKRVFYRAVRACPWAQELYLLAFKDMRAIMEDQELMGVYELMWEKEIRVHVGLENVKEGMSAQRDAALSV